MARCFGLIPAAGTGSRSGLAVPKQYMPLAGKPMLYHAVKRLCDAAAIARVFLVLATDDQRFAAWDWAEFQDKLRALFCGGATRAESVRNGLMAASEIGPDDWVLVHDAARPCLSEEALARLIREVANDRWGGLLAAPVADTLKRADRNGRVEETVARERLWQAQTPQMFRRGALLEALGRSGGAGATDEASAMEALGFAPKLVESDLANLKVTYPQDFQLAELILRSRA